MSPCRVLAAVVAIGLIGGAAHAAESRARAHGWLRPAVDRSTGVALATQPEERPFPFLPGERDDLSIAVGDTSNGYLVNGVRLAESDALGILPKLRERDVRYGTAELVGLLEHAARALHQETGTRLWVGNLSRRGGGDLPWSVSHNSGRDVDVALCYLDRSGKPAYPDDMVPINRLGRSAQQKLRFDRSRSWLVVKALLEYRGAAIQHLFIAGSLRAQLLEEARSRGEKGALVQRAAKLLKYPADSSWHNDHFHLRVYCSERDLLGGCVNTGVIPPGVELYRASQRRFADDLTVRLGAADPSERSRAVERLVLLGARDKIAAVRARLGDDSAAVRLVAARAMGILGGPSHVTELRDRLAGEVDGGVRLALVEAMAALRGGDAVTPRPRREQMQPRELWRRLADAEGSDLGALLPPAMQLGRSLWRREELPELFAVLEDGDGAVRAGGARALSFLTNHPDTTDWASGSAEELQRGRQQWRQKWEERRGKSLGAWVLGGFDRAGYAVPAYDEQHAWELIRAIAGPEHLSYNAQQTLIRVTGHRPDVAGWSRAEVCRYWLNWLEPRWKRWRLMAPPSRLGLICRSAGQSPP